MDDGSLDPAQDCPALRIAQLEAELAGCRTELQDMRAAKADAAVPAHGRSFEERAAQLARVNAVLRRGVERTTGERDFGRLLGHLLLEAAEAAEAAGGALFLHKGGTAFEPAAVVDAGAIVPPEQWRRDPLFDGFAERSGRDADGSFAALLARGVGDPAPVDAATLWPEAVAWHQARGNRTIWNEPLVLGSEVVGFLGLARADERPPEPEVVETVRAVVDQMAVAVQLARLAGEAREAAVARERAADLARANAALQGTAARLTDEGGLDALLGHVLTEASAAVGSRSASLFVHEPAAGTLAMRAFVDQGLVLDRAADPRLEVWRRPVVLDAETWPWWESICKGQHLEGAVGVETADDAHAWPVARAFHRAMGHKAVLCLPLVAGGRALGFLGLDFAEPPRLAMEKVNLAQALAQQASLALQLTRLAGEAREAAVAREREQAAEQRAQELARANAALTRSTARLAEQADLDAFLGGVLLEAAEQAGAIGNALFLYDPRGHTLSMISYVRDGALLDIAVDPRLALWREPVSADLTPVWERMKASRPVLQVVGVEHPDAWAFAVPWHQAMGHASLICVPLFAGERALGLMGLCFATTDAIAPERVELTQALANQAALALELTRLAGEAREAAVAREREQAAVARAAELGQVNEVLRRVVGNLADVSHGALDDAFLRRTVVECCRASGATNAALFLRDGAEGFRTRLAPMEADGAPAPLQRKVRAFFDADAVAAHSRRDERGLFARLLAGEVVLARTGDADGPLSPEARAWHAARGHRTVLDVPMMVGARVVGYLGLAFGQAAEPDASAIGVLRALAGQAALAAELGRLAGAARDAAVAREREQAAEERAAELAQANAALRQAVESLRDLDDLDAFLARVVTAAEQVSGARGATVFLMDEDKREITMRLFVQDGAVLDIAADPALAFWREPLTEGRGYDQRINDMIFNSPGHWWVAVDDPLMPPASRAWHEAQGHRSVAHVPMFRDGRPLGFLGLGFREALRPSAAKLEMAQVLAQQVTLAFELTRLAEEAQEAAVTREKAAELARANEALRHGLDVLAGGSDYASTLGQILAAAVETLGGTGGSFFLVNDAETEARLYVNCDGGITEGNLRHPSGWDHEPVPLTPELHAQVRRDGFVWHDERHLATMPIYAPYRARLAEHGVRSVLTIPAFLGERWRASFSVRSRRTDAYTDAELELARILAKQGMLVAQLTRLANEAHDAAVSREREQAAQERAAELARANAALARSTARLAAEPDLDAFLGGVLVEAAEQAGACGNALFLYDPASDTLAMRMHALGGELLDPATDPRLAIWREPVPASLTTAWKALQQREPLLQVVDTPDPDLWPHTVSWHRGMGHTFLISIALIAGERILGFMGLCFRDPQAVAPERIELAQALANHAALALEMTRLADEAREAAVVREREATTREHAARLADANQALTRSTARLAAEPELEGFLRSVLEEAAGQAGAFANALMLYDASAHALRMRLYVREGEALDVATDPRMAIWREPVPADLGPAWAELSAGKPVTHLASPEDRYTWPHTVDWHAAMGHAMVVAVPLLAGERAIGFMGLSFRQRGEVAPEALGLAQALASQAVLAMELTRLTAVVRESEARLLLAHDAAGIGTWDWDLATGDVVWAPHTFRLWGIAPPVQGSHVLPAETVLRAIHPQDRPRVRAELAAAVARGEPFRSEFRVGGAEGEERWLEGLGRPVAPGAGPGRAGRMIGVNLDVTERRVAEQAHVDRERLAELARANAALRETLDALPTGHGDAAGALNCFLARVLAAVAGLLGAPAAVLWLHDADANATRVHQVFRDGAVVDAAASGLAEAGRPIPLASMDPGWTRPDATAPPCPVHPELIDDVATDRRLTDAHRARLLAQGIRALVLLPLALRGEQNVGTVSLRLPAPRRFAPEDMELALALAQQATLAIHLDQLARRARDEARQSAVLDERNRAAQEIHDTLAQGFTSIFLQLQAAARFADSKPELARACLGRAETLARDGLAEARRSVASLLPGAEEHRDLPGALRRLAHQATAGTSAPATVRVAGTPRALAPDVASNLYRIAQEALGNAQRYAQGATGIQLRLRYGADGVGLAVRDDGCGFDPSAVRHGPGHGLAGMQARAGRIGASLSLDSQTGRGTSVRIDLPRNKEGS